MINTIKKLFEDLQDTNSKQSGSQEKSIELATAVLMLEISLADDHIHDQEREMIKKLLLNNFELDDEQINILIETAEKEVDHAVSLYEFTRLLNDSLTMPDKKRIIEHLWHIANADAVIDKYEEYYIRKIADLLYISHSDYIQAKLKADQ